MSRIFQHALVACARWETESIVEWLTYHRHIGFDHCYLYCNDDDPTELFEAILPFSQGENPFVDFHHFGLQGQQEQMYRHFLRNYAQETCWFSCLDIDEFILLKKFDNLGQFLRHFPESPDAILLHMVTAGYNGYKERPVGNAIKNYQQRSDYAMPWTKAIVRSAALQSTKFNAALDQAWNHNIGLILRNDSKIIDVIGNDATEYYQDLESRLNKIGHEWVVVGQDREYHDTILANAFVLHYWIKSEADLLRGYRRGTKGQFGYQTFLKDVGELGSERIAEFFSGAHKADERHLVEVWDAMVQQGAQKGQIVPAPSGINVATTGKAAQSSVCDLSVAQNSEDDAAGLIDGRPTAKPHHHTTLERNPWWMLTLPAPSNISEIRIFNRVDTDHQRPIRLTVNGKCFQEPWRQIYSSSEELIFGGVDGTPLILKLNGPFSATDILITAIGKTHLDFSQIEVYEAGESNHAIGRDKRRD